MLRLSMSCDKLDVCDKLKCYESWFSLSIVKRYLPLAYATCQKNRCQKILQLHHKHQNILVCFSSLVFVAFGYKFKRIYENIYLFMVFFVPYIWENLEIFICGGIAEVSMLIRDCFICTISDHSLITLPRRISYIIDIYIGPKSL